MPPEPRRNSRKISNDEEIEVKRARGEISCAECRRLKLKCDKKLPCGSCVRRGCTTICPNGSLSAGQGTRFILADTEQLHRKISEMSERIRQLEDALAIFQAGISNERHHLLRDELLSIKFGPEVRRTVDDEHSRNALSQSIDALGTLTIGDNGETKYIGRSGGSETLFLTDTSNTTPPDMPAFEVEEVDVSALDPQLEKIASAFLWSNTLIDHEQALDKLESCLPPQPRAWALCETYLEQCTWWFRPIKRDELINEILIPIYKSMANPQKSTYSRKGDAEASRCPHLLAVLYMVLAVGCLVDLTVPSCSAEAEKYYRLGRAALSLRSFFDSPELETVQAVSLMACYHSICTSRYTLESAWSLASLASKLAQSIGLHRDSAPWKLDVKIVQRRRNLFWELFTFEIVHCVALGRPPSVALSHVDCELPSDEDSTLDENGDVLHGFWKWKFLFSKEVYLHVIDALLQAKAPSYEVILDLDKKIRQMTLPAVRLYLRPDEDGYTNPALCMKCYLMSQYRSITMMHIHKTFFAQALLDYPSNPLASPYAPSFLAANRCASVVIKSFIHHYERCPDLCSRFWSIWTHAFSAAVVLGSTVICSPSVSMAASALTEIELVLEIFMKGASKSMRARQALPMLRELKSKADNAYKNYRNRHASPALDIQLNIGPEFDVSTAKLAIFGGQTRVMSSKVLNRRRPKVITSPSPAPSSVTSPSTETPGRDPSPTGSPPASTPSSDGGVISQSMSDAFAQVHPSLVEYLSLFPSSSSMALVDPSQQPLPNGIGLGGPISPVLSQPSQHAYGPTQPMHTGIADPNHFPNFMPGMPSTNQNPSMSMQYPQSVLGDPSLVALNHVPNLSFPEDFVMGDHWLNLMRETGIFENTSNFTGMNGEEPMYTFR